MALPELFTLEMAWGSQVCAVPSLGRLTHARACVCVCPKVPRPSQVRLLWELMALSSLWGLSGFLTLSGPPHLLPTCAPAPLAARHISTCLTLRGCGMGRLSSLSAAISMKKGFRIRICLGLTSQMSGGCFQKPFRT